MVKKQAASKPTAYHRFVIGLGYTLFTFMVLSVVFSTILPFAHILTSPNVRIVNVVVFLISLVVGALLPSILAYVFGDSSTRSKSHKFHHYNGIMFGVLAYWVNIIVNQFDTGLTEYVRNVIPSAPTGLAVAFSIPVIITALIVGVIAYFYHRGKGKQVEISNYRPFQISLFAAVAVLLVVTPLQASSSNGFWDVWVVTIVMAVIILLSYVCLWHLTVSVWRKLTLAVTALTFAFITFFVASQLQTNIYSDIGDLRSVPIAATILVSVLVWMLYLYIARQSYRK